MIEDSFIGVVDGFSSQFTSQSCTGGMANVVDSSFSMIDNIEIYIPEHTMKFFISSNNLQDSTNTVIAWCDFEGITNKFSRLTNYRQYE